MPRSYYSEFSTANRSRPVTAIIAAATAVALGACSGPKSSHDASDNRQYPSNISLSDSMQSATSGEAALQTCDPLTKSHISLKSGRVGFCEEQQATGGATVFERYQDASAVKLRLVAGATVVVSCVAFGPAAAAPGAATDRHHPGEAEWYKIVEPKDEAGYAASNAFWNVQDHTIPFKLQPTFDPRVPAC